MSNTTTHTRPLAETDLLHMPATLVELARQRASLRPNDVAYEFLQDGEEQSERVSYDELDQRARHVAGVVQDLGAEAEPVLLLFDPGVDYIAALLGCLYAGAIAVPADPRRADRHGEWVRRMLAGTGAQYVLTSESLRDALGGQLSRSGAAVVTPFAQPESRGDAWVRPELGADTPALLQYTCGSTGASRGVLLTHANLLHNLAQIAHAFEITRADKMLSWSAPYRGMGLVGGVLQPLYSGCASVLMPTACVLERPWRWLRAISRHRATISGAPTFAYDLCLRSMSPGVRADFDLRSWQVAFTGGEPVQPRTLWQFSRAFAANGFQPRAFAPCYGLAEETMMVAARRRDDPPVIRSMDADELARGRGRTVPVEVGRFVVGCGRPCAGQRLRIVNSDRATACADGEVGEIWVSGPGTGQTFGRRADGSAHASDARIVGSGEGPFVRTGDRGFLSDGELFVLGKLDDVMTIRGRSYDPQEVEEVVDASHVSLKAGCGVAFSVPADDGHEALVVAYEVRREALRALDVAVVTLAVRIAVEQELGLQVHDVVLLRPGGLPETVGGRAHRGACRKLYEEGSLTRVMACSPVRSAGRTHDGVPRAVVLRHVRTIALPARGAEISRALRSRRRLPASRLP